MKPEEQSKELLPLTPEAVEQVLCFVARHGTSHDFAQAEVRRLNAQADIARAREERVHRKVLLGQVLAWGFAAVMVGVGGGYVAVWLAPESPWAYQWRYSFKDGMSGSGAVVTVDARPHNCDFSAAPLGSKNCHYKRHVATIRVRTSTAGRTVSFDEGRTWTLDNGSTQPAVWVTWEKVED